MAMHRTPRQQAQGFTLVELLVALVVMALLSLMSWRGLDAMSRAQTQIQERSDALQTLQSGLAQWSADLDAMDNELGNTSSSNLPSPLDWNGQVLRITRSSGAGQDSGLRVVAWAAGTVQGQKVWLRWQSPQLHNRATLQEAWLQAGVWAQTPTVASRARQVSITPLLEWQIFYNRSGAWSNPGSSSDVANQNPDGVRLQLSLPPGQALTGWLTKDWIRPTAVGAKS
jgi:general secretion pathway protein J